MSQFESFFGAKLLTKAGEEESTSSLLSGKKVVGIYFSAHWW
jgi:hypothetical protein